MRNKVVKKLLMIAMAVTMISGTSIATVYANANPPAEETTTQVVEENGNRINRRYGEERGYRKGHRGRR